MRTVATGYSWLIHVQDVLDQRYRHQRPYETYLSFYQHALASVMLCSMPGSWLVTCPPGVFRYLQEHLKFGLFLEVPLHERVQLYASTLGHCTVNTKLVHDILVSDGYCFALRAELDATLEWWEDLAPLDCGSLNLPFAVEMRTTPSHG